MWTCGPARNEYFHSIWRVKKKIFFPGNCPGIFPISYHYYYKRASCKHAKKPRQTKYWLVKKVTAQYRYSCHNYELTASIQLSRLPWETRTGVSCVAWTGNGADPKSRYILRAFIPYKENNENYNHAAGHRIDKITTRNQIATCSSKCLIVTCSRLSAWYIKLIMTL